jgi:uncharacterized membrane protein YhfC
MISEISILSMGIVGSACIMLPLLAFAFFKRPFELKLKPVFVGAAVFAVFALVLEQALHAFVLGQDRGVSLAVNSPWLYGLYASFAAGIFEETGRFLAFRFVLKRSPRPETAVAYGIGHGGIEAILLAALPILVMFAASISFNSTGEAPFAPEVLAAAKSAAPSAYFAGLLERVSAMAIQISLSVFVWAGASRKGMGWMYPAAILAHAAFDLPVALFQAGRLSIPIWALEAAIFAIAACSSAAAAYFLKKLRRFADAAEAISAPYNESAGGSGL